MVAKNSLSNKDPNDAERRHTPYPLLPYSTIKGAHHIDTSPQQADERIRISFQSVAHNSTLIFAFQAGTKLLGFVSAILLANYLGAAGFGAYNYAFALTSLFIPLCDLGMDVYLVREVPRQSLYRSRELLGSIFINKVLLGILVFAAIAVAGVALESPASEAFTFILLAGLVTILRAYWTTFSGILRATDRVRHEAWLFTAARVAEFGVILYCYTTAAPITTILGLLVLVNAVAISGTFAFMNGRLIRPSMPAGAEPFIRVIRGGLPFAVTTVFVSIYFNLDTVLVTKISGSTSAGYYRAAYNLVLPLMMVTSAISGAVFPFVSQNFKDDPASVGTVIRRAVSILLMIGIPISVLGAFGADGIVGLLFDAEYALSGDSLRILVWFIPVVFLTNLFGSALGAMDLQSYVVKVAGANVTFNIVANSILIPQFAELGAAVVTVLTELLGFSLLYRKVATIVSGPVNLSVLLRVIISTLPALSWLAFAPIGSFVPDFAVACIVCAAGLFVFRATSVSELRKILTFLE